MLSEERKKEIYKKAQLVNEISEKYQLIHATFAVQKIANEIINQTYAQEFKNLRQELSEVNLSKEKQRQMYEKKKMLEVESRRNRINISIQYIEPLKGMNATTTKIGTYKNSFIISLPQELEDIRNQDGMFNYEKMKKLRWLMAHELGHILLHSDCIDENGFFEKNGNEEDESDFFAKSVIKLRQERNGEFYSNDNFKNI